MSALYQALIPRRVTSSVVGFWALVCLGLLLPTASARAAAPRYSDILPLSRVKPGMEGYGLTTFKGNTISRFKVKIIGILRKENVGHDLILIRMQGGPITRRSALLIHGMSGSPIYIGNKIIGAFSMGEEFPKEPLGMVTPIEDMLEAWDPAIPQHPSYFQPAEKNAPKAASEGARVGANWPTPLRTRVATLPHPIVVGNRRISKLVLNAHLDDPRHSTATMAVMHPATSMMSITGGSERDRAWLQQELTRLGYNVMIVRGGGSGGKHPFKAAPLRPGSVFGTSLATGDIELTAYGTVTYRRGNRILGFGHPLMGLGPLEAAITSAYVVDVFPGYETSHIMAVTGSVLGTLMQDRNFSVSGELGRMPHLIPFTVTVRDHMNHRSQTFRSQVFQHPELTPPLLRYVARAAVTILHSEPGDAMARVTTTLDADEVGRVTRTNLVFDADDISGAVPQDLSDITGIVSGNPFYPLPIHSGSMTVDITPGHNTATVERIFLKQGHYEPGDNLEVGVVLKPYRRDPILRTVSLKLPSDLPSGRYQLIVRGGAPSIVRLGPFILSGGSTDQQTPPVNVRQMVARLNERETNTDMVARLILNSVAPALEGEKLSQLPPNLSALMRSERNSGVRLERDEIRTTQPSDYVLTGTQQLVVTVVRKSTQEQSGGNASFGGPTMPNPPGSGTPTTPGNPPSGNLNEEGTQDVDSLPGARVEGGGTSADRWMAAEETKPDAGDSKSKAPSQPKTKKENKKRRPEKGKPATDAAPAASTETASTSTAKSEDTGSDKPVGRQLQTWRQSARTDFGQGSFYATSVSANGELRLAPTLRRLASTAETYIWSLAADDKGNLYAGTGTSGKILKVDKEGQIIPFASLPVVAVQSLLLGRDGMLWAGSGVKGSLFKVAPDGTYKLVRSLPEKYILALAEDSKGNLYIGPGGGGTVYKIAAGDNSATATPFLKTNADHVMALAVDSGDNLYVGTGNEGTLYKVTPDGKSSVLYDAKENSITALAVDGAGNVYAGTGPKGLLYRIAPDGTAAVLYDRATAFYTGLKLAPDGTLYASTVNTIYHILPAASGDASDTTIQSLDNPKEVDFLTLTVAPDGSVYTGTGNVGEIYTTSLNAGKQGAQTGTYESVIHDARLISRWGTARWNAQTPTGTSVRVETRTGNVAEPDSTWSAWSPVQMVSGYPAEGTVTSPPARFIQYRLTLETTSPQAQPAVREVAIGYMPRNQAPKVSFQAPTGGERWAKTQTIRWNGEDPDKDTLTYALYYSNDAGATWKPLPTDGKAAETSQATSTGAKSAAPAAGKTDLGKRIENDPSIPPALKEMALKSVRDRQSADSQAAGATTMRETSKTWDTKTLPDGTYWLKVVASDRLSNPVDAQTAQAISEPFIICNAPPQLTMLSPVVGPDGGVKLEGSVSQPLIEVTAVQYRVDGGDWIAAVPKDGLFDTPQEAFTLSTGPLAKGKHTLEVKAFNAAGSTATSKIEVNVP